MAIAKLLSPYVTSFVIKTSGVDFTENTNTAGGFQQQRNLISASKLGRDFIIRVPKFLNFTLSFKFYGGARPDFSAKISLVDEHSREKATNALIFIWAGFSCLESYAYYAYVYALAVNGILGLVYIHWEWSLGGNVTVKAVEDSSCGRAWTQ